jgi:acetyl-CoA synthetase
VDPIQKPKPETLPVVPNIVDYEEARKSFRWESLYRELDWLPDGGLNKAHECIDRHARGKLRDKPAMLWEDKDGQTETYTFGDLERETNKFANVLESLGVKKGDRVFFFMERWPEQYIGVFGAL